MSLNVNNLVTTVGSTSWKEVLVILVVAAIVGFILAKLKLPALSPESIVGIVGIFGLWLGYVLGK